MSEHVLTGTHNSYNVNATTGAPFETPRNQNYSISQQLEFLGVRVIEIDPHYVESTNFTASDDFARTVTCHVRTEAAQLALDFCNGGTIPGVGTGNWTYCNAAGVFDYGNDTLCPQNAPTVNATFEEIRTWLDDTGNEEEFVILFLDHFMDDKVTLLDTLVNDYFGDVLYTRPGGFDTENPDWPTVETLVADGKRVMVFSLASRTDRTDPGDYMWDQSLRNQGSADSFDGSACTATGSGTISSPPGDFTYIKGDVTQYILEDVLIQDSTNGGANIIDVAMAKEIVACGFNPSFDGMDVSLMDARLWSFTDSSRLSMSDSCVKVHGDGTTGWESVACSTSLKAACRNDSDSSDWTVSTGSSAFDSTSCPAGYSFKAPSHPLHVKAILDASAGADAWLNIEHKRGCWFADGGTSCTLGVEDANPRLVEVNALADSVTIKNFGGQAIDLTNHQFCSRFSYSTLGSLSVTSGSLNLAADASVTLTWTLNDASSDVGLYVPSPTFSDADDMVDFVEYGASGLGRESVAVSKGIWDSGVFVSGTSPYTYSGDGEQTGPSFWAGLLPEIDVSPASLSFGSQGVSDGATTVETVLVNNTGTAELSITSTIAITGADAADFTISAGTTAAGTIAAGGFRELSITFDPSSTGVKSASLVIQSDDADESSVSVTLGGTGIQPNPRLVEVNALTDSVTIKNFGGQAIDLTSHQFCSRFSYSTLGSLSVTSGSLSLAADASVTVTWTLNDASSDVGLYVPSPTFSDADDMVDFVEYGASGLGRESVAVSKGIWDSGVFVSGMSPYTYSGDGEQTGPSFWAGLLPEIDVSPASLSFGSQGVADGATAVQTVLVNNTGTAELSITSTIAITGADAADFAISAGTTAAGTIAAGGFRELSITFDPSSTGVKSASLVIQSDDPDESSVSVTLGGTGIEPNPRLVEVNALTDSVTIKNFGGQAIDLTNHQFCSRFSYSTLGSLSVTSGSLNLAADASVTLTWTLNDASSDVGLYVPSPTFSDADDMVDFVEYGASGLGRESVAVNKGIWDSGVFVSGTSPYTYSGDGEQTGPSFWAGLLPEIDVSPASLSFGSRPIADGATTAETVLVNNTGEAELSITSTIAITGADAADFTISAGTTAAGVIAAGGFRELSITFDPSSTGAKSASLVIESDDPDEASVSVTFSGTGTAPDIALSKTSLDFGSQPVAGGATSNQVVRVSNEGNATLEITSTITITGTNAADFAITAGSTAIGFFAPGAFRDISVAFDPSSAGAKSASLVIESNDADEPSVSVTLSGTGTAPEIDVSPTSLDFGSQPVADGATTAETVLVNNTGTADLSVTSTITITGTDAADFAISAGSTAAGAIAAGGFRELSITFDPSSAGAKSASLVIQSDDADESSVSVTLSGTGTAPEIDVSPTSLDFGSQPIADGATTAETVQVNNTGAADLSVTSTIVITGTDAADFAISAGTTAAGVIAAGGFRELSITFDPSSAGAKSASLVIESDDSDEPSVNVALTGTGTTPEIDVSPTSLDFGSQPVADGATTAETVQVNNTGTAELSISSMIAITGADAADFTISAGTTAAGAIAAGGFRELSVTFDPSSAGVKSASLVIESDDVDEPSVSVALSGTGIEPNPRLVEVNPLTDSVTIKNFGGQAIDLTNHQFCSRFSYSTLGSLSVTSGSLNLAADASVTLTWSLNDASSDVGLYVPSPTFSDADDMVDFVEYGASGLGRESVAVSKGIWDSGAFVSGTSPYTYSGDGEQTGPSFWVGPAPEIDVSPTSLDFGSQGVSDGATTAETVLVNNTGTAELSITSTIAITGADAADFAISAGTTAAGVIAAGGFRELSITFDPSSAGAKSASLVIESDDVDEPSVSVTLGGTGIEPNPRLVEVNALTDSVTIKNFGGQAIDLTNHQFCSRFSYSTLGSLSVTSGSLNLAADASVTLTWTLNDASSDVGLYVPSPTFSDADDMVDFVEYGASGLGRESVAVSKGIWDSGVFVSGTPPFTYSGDGEQTGPSFWAGLLPEIDVSPASLSFGSQGVADGATAVQTVLVNNTGEAELSITSTIAITGADAADFAISAGTTAAGVIAAGGFRELSITFDPSSTGVKSASLVIQSDDADEPSVSVTLGGTGTAPEIDVSPTSLNFGSQPVADGATPTQNVRVSNDGDANLQITSTIAITGTNAADFSITAGLTAAGAIAAGGIRDLLVAFDPSSAGVKSASLVIESDDVDESSVSVTLSGTGTDTLAPANPRLVEVNALTDSVTIKNFGGQAIDLTNHQFCSRFSYSTLGSLSVTSGSLNLAADASVTLTWTLNDASSDVGLYVPSPTFSDADDMVDFVEYGASGLGRESVAVSKGIWDSGVFVSGTPPFTYSGDGEQTGPSFWAGLSPEIDVSPTSLDFGSQPIADGATAVQTVLVNNTGEVELSVTSTIAITGAGAIHFAISAGTTAAGTIAAGGFRELSITFDPSSAGVKSASLVIQSDDADEPSVSVTLGGTGTAPEIDVSPTSLDFGSQPVADGASPTQNVRVSNDGDANLQITSTITITGTDAADFSITAGLTAAGVILPGGIRDLLVAFDPSSAGAKSASLVIESDGVEEPSVSVTLSGTGTAPNLRLLHVNALTDSVTIKNFGTAPVDISDYQMCSRFSYNTFRSLSVTAGSLDLAAGESVTVTWSLNDASSDVGLYVPSPSFTNPAHMVDFMEYGASGVGRETVAVSKGIWEAGVFVAGTSPFSYSGDGAQTGPSFWATSSPEIAVSPASIDFGSRTVNTTGAARTVTISNVGTAALQVSSISLGGTHASDFSLAGGTGSSAVAAGGTRQVVVLFEPVTAGTKTATLTIASDDSDEAAVSVSISGIGLSVANPRLLRVSPLTDQVTIKNFGDTAVDVSNHVLCSRGSCATVQSATSATVELDGDAEVVVPWVLDDEASDVALFKASPDVSSADDLLDFFQYGAAGLGSEAVAAAAGLWTAGSFVTGEPPYAYDGDGSASTGENDWNDSTEPSSSSSDGDEVSETTFIGAAVGLVVLAVVLIVVLKKCGAPKGSSKSTTSDQTSSAVNLTSMGGESYGTGEDDERV